MTFNFTLLVIFLIAEVATCLECYTCAGPTCSGEVATRNCDFLGQDTACVTYELSGLSTKSCYLASLCGNNIPGITDINCCTTDLCNSYSVLKAKYFALFASIILSFALKS